MVARLGKKKLFNIFRCIELTLYVVHITHSMTAYPPPYVHSYMSTPDHMKDVFPVVSVDKDTINVKGIIAYD